MNILGARSKPSGNTALTQARRPLQQPRTEKPPQGEAEKRPIKQRKKEEEVGDQPKLHLLFRKVVLCLLFFLEKAFVLLFLLLLLAYFLPPPNRRVGQEGGGGC